MRGRQLLPGVPGGGQTAGPASGVVAALAVQVTATVVEIDHKTREVTLKAADGREETFVVDEAAKNLDQVKKGDVVVATYAEALAYEVKKGGTTGIAAVRDREARREAGRGHRPRDDRDGHDHGDRREGPDGHLQGAAGQHADDQGQGRGEAQGSEGRGPGRDHLHAGARPLGREGEEEQVNNRTGGCHDSITQVYRSARRRGGAGHGQPRRGGRHHARVPGPRRQMGVHARTAVCRLHDRRHVRRDEDRRQQRPGIRVRVRLQLHRQSGDAPRHQTGPP